MIMLVFKSKELHLLGDSNFVVSFNSPGFANESRQRCCSRHLNEMIQKCLRRVDVAETPAQGRNATILSFLKKKCSSSSFKMLSVLS